MRQRCMILCFPLLAVLAACGGSGGSGGVQLATPTPPPVSSPAAPAQGTRTITFGGVSVQVVISIPPAAVKDALVLYHPTVWFDDRILPAAESTLENFKRLLYRDDLLLVCQPASKTDHLPASNFDQGSEPAGDGDERIRLRDLPFDLGRSAVCRVSGRAQLRFLNR